MQVIKPMALGLTTRPIEFRRRLGLVVTGSLFFPFRPVGEQAVWTDTSMWKFLGEQMPEGPFIDECCIKGHSEYLVRAIAHPPGGRAQACEAVARVAGLEKRVHAVGPRFWKGREASAPDFFDALPLDWRHTYGGPDHPTNPLGMGRAPIAGPDGQPLRPLPQVVLPGMNPGTPDDAVPSVAFGTIDCTWPQRARHAGTYDDGWLKEQSPGFASDMDWHYFNLAQEDQWFETPPRGDEAFEFQHMHPTKPVVGGVLPALRVRCFLDYGDGTEPKLREVSMKVATLWFFPHAECGIVLFQGLAQCQEDDASDVHTLMGAVEYLSETKPAQHYLDALKRRRHPTDGPLYGLRESDLMPAGLKGGDAAFDAVMDDYKPEGLAGQAQRRGAMLKMHLAIDEVKAKGVDPAKLGLKLPQPEPVPSLEELPEYLIKKRAEALNVQVTAALDMVEQMNAATAKAKAAGIDPAALAHRGPPAYRAAEHLKQLQSVVPAGGMDVEKLAPKLLQMEAMARKSYLATAHAQAPAPAMPPERAQAVRTAIMKAHAEGKSFFGNDLTGADLSGLDLSGADFTQAWLEGVNFAGAKLQRCSFAYAVLAHADLTGADLSEADLTGANLGRAKLATTRFVKADLSGAVFNDTALARTDLRGARIDKLQLQGATFGLADWRSVQGGGLVFHKQVLKDMVFNRCALSQPVFIECDLSGVDFAAAQLERPTFIKCTATGSRFAKAQMAGAVFVDGCDFSQADFSEALLDGSNLRGQTFAGALFRQTRLDGADLSDANATGADLTGAALRSALLIKTRLGQARLVDANLMNALLPRADLRGADLSNANLYGSDVSRIHADTTTQLHGANFDRAKTYPRREPRPA